MEKRLNDSMRKQSDRSRMGTFYRQNAPDSSKSLIVNGTIPEAETKVTNCDA